MSIIKSRLDQLLMHRKYVSSRSRAEDLIKRGFVKINGKIESKPGFIVHEDDRIDVSEHESFVSRAGEKLFSVKKTLNLDFENKTVLDVGSSTGGFTELALRYGARKVIAVDVGTDQMHISLRNNPRIDLHEKTDIRDFKTNQKIDVVVADVSFISLRQILPHVSTLMSRDTMLIAMVKPQFEAGSDARHKGVIKNDSIRRNILKDFEIWTQKLFVIVAKADSGVAGAKGNKERFYVLKLLKK